ncbi:CRE-CPT-6 protein, partial [Aphelenchoides avenae]
AASQCPLSRNTIDIPVVHGRNFLASINDSSFVRPTASVSSDKMADSFATFTCRALLFGSNDVSRWLRAIEAAIFSLTCTYGFVVVSRLFVSRFILGYKGYLFEGRKPSMMTKVWAISRKVLIWLSPPQLESCEALLPAQPVPSLEGTVKRYLESMEPLLSKEEFEKLCQLADEFVQNEGLKLQFYAKVYSWTVPNYVTPFWERFAYLASRQPLLGNSSLGYVDFYTNISLDQARRAACVAYTETLFSLACYREQVRPLGDGLLSTSRYKRCHGQTRVPGKTGDTLVSNMPARHVAVIAKGHIYSVDMFDRQGRIYDLEKVYEIFIDILRQPGRCKNDAASRIPAFTADRRDKWCENRRRFFLENPTNRASLEIIESAVIIITLEEADDYGYDLKNPAPLDKFMKAMLTGDGGDRWADKCKNYVVSKNGRIGGTTEHSPADGSEFDHARELYSYIETKVQKHPPHVKALRDVKNWQPPADLKLAKRLDFDVTPEMAKEIERCYEEYQPIKDDIDVATLVFNCFGKGAIKNFKCSPDGFVQMALQLTYFKLHSRFVQTYEPASSRFYRNSRTEALRTVSKESCAFVRAMVDGKTVRE